MQHGVTRSISNTASSESKYNEMKVCSADTTSLSCHFIDRESRQSFLNESKLPTRNFFLILFIPDHRNPNVDENAVRLFLEDLLKVLFKDLLSFSVDQIVFMLLKATLQLQISRNTLMKSGYNK